MNWTKLSAISEILSSVAILVTLIYLGVQTQQNADAIQADTRQEILAADQQFLMSFVADPGLEVLRYKPEVNPRRENPTRLPIDNIHTNEGEQLVTVPERRVG